MVHAAKHALPFVILVVFTAAALRGIPSDTWRTPLGNPCHFATIAGLALAVGLTVTPLLGSRGFALEPAILAIFLGAMPLVYVASWFASPPVSLLRLGIELLAVPVYGALALLGVRRSRWWLVVGIAGHGVCWDAWHIATTGVVPGWYATACLWLDVGIAACVAARIWTQGDRLAAVAPREPMLVE
jgi:hypothetical protein